MATYSANGSGSQFSSYMHSRVEVTRTDYDTYSTLAVTCKVVSDGGSSSFIAGRATASSSGSYGSYSSEQSVSAYGTTTLKTQTFNVTRGTSAKTLACKASILGGGTGMYAGKYDEASVNVTIPAISYDVPNAPSSLTATYVSDSSATLSWTNGTTTTTKPRTATVVERQTDGGAWAQVASVSASSTSYTDNGIEANHSYAYRVAAQNSVGLSTYATSSAIYTTPAAPASVTLDKTSATAVTVDVTGSMPYATGYDVQSTYDNGATWQTDATGVSMPYAATVGAGTVIFRVRSTRGALESAWTQSAALVTITPPLAPTITQAPANPTAYGDSDTISWSPNHPDGSAQAKAEIKVTDPSNTSTTYTVNGTGTSYTLTPNATGTWTAQVRTKGLDATMGAWSQAVSWTVANPPAVAITNPATDGATVTALPLAIAWTVTDGTGVSAQRMIIEDVGGTEIYNKTLAANATSASLTASDVALVNGESYAIKLRVMGGSGLVTVQTRTFQVSWTAPAEPMLAIYEGDGSSASIDVILPSSSGSGETVEFSEGGIVTSLSIEGKSVQDGTPTPSAPVAIQSVQGWNLLDDSNIYNLAVGGSSLVENANYRGAYCKIPTTTGDTKYTISRNIVEGNRFQVWSTVSEPANGVIATACFTWDNTALTATFTVPANQSWLFVYLSNSGGTFTQGNLQIVAGTEDKAVVPYGNISIAGNTVTPTTTPIDLQGHALRSLPDGTHDELTVDAAGNVSMVKRVGVQVFDGSVYVPWVSGSGTYTRFGITFSGLASCTVMCEQLTERATLNLVAANAYSINGTNDNRLYISLSQNETTGADATAALAANPITVYYKLATPQTISLGTITPPYIPDESTVWVDAEVTPEIDVTIRNAPSATTPATDSVDVLRVNADGTTWTVAENLSDGSSCIDPLPPLGVPVEYRAIASAASGATMAATFTETFGGKDWTLNFGNAAQESISMRYNPDASYALVQGGASYHFADGGAGGGRPVFYPTTDRDESGGLKFATIGSGDADRLRDLCDRYPVAWLRDPFGHRWRARVKPSWTHGVGQLWPLSISWDAVRWEEAW